LADRYDHAGVFGDGQELPRRRAHALDVAAYERLDTRDGSCLDLPSAVMHNNPGVQEHIAAGFPGLTLDGLETHVWVKNW